MVIPTIAAFSWCCLLLSLIIKAQIPSKISAKQPIFPLDKLFHSYCGRCVRKHSGSWLSNEMKPNRKLNRKSLPQRTLSHIGWGKTDALHVCVHARVGTDALITITPNIHRSPPTCRINIRNLWAARSICVSADHGLCSCVDTCMPYL